MKKLLNTILALSLVTTATAQDMQQLEIGTEMPGADIKMKATAGEDISLSDVKKENGLLVMFSCNTCPYVVKSQARTREIMDYAAKNNIGVIIINSNEAQREEADSYDAMKKYAKTQGYKVPYVVDEGSKLANTFGATRTPEVFLYNRDNVLMYHGAMEDNPATPDESKEMYLRNAMDKIMAGAMPEPSFTRSVGCSIKRKS